MNNLRNLALWIMIALLLVALFNLFQGTTQPSAMRADHVTPNSTSEVIQGAVKDVTIQGEHHQGPSVQRPGLHDLSPERPQSDRRMMDAQCEHQCPAGR